MKCPACKGKLSEIVIQGIAVDICNNGCGGIWFDQHEIKKFDESHEGAGEELLHIATVQSISSKRPEKLPCPKCKDTLMMRHFWSSKQKVELDECGVCGGYWLDCGELRAIRNQFATEAERKEAAKRYFQDVLGEKIEARKEVSRKKLEAAKKFAEMFKFICPSYYIPGKQKWGAF